MTKAKRKRRRGGSGVKKKSGVLMGMRSGFKNVAHTVTGTGEEKAKSRRSQMLSTAFTIILVIAAAALLYRRFR